MAEEYRVTWRREGLSTRSKVYQSRPSADRWMLILQGQMQEATDLDPDAYACCSGDMCGCRGQTNSEAWAERTVTMPALLFARLEARQTGEWELREHTALDAKVGSGRA